VLYQLSHAPLLSAEEEVDLSACLRTGATIPISECTWTLLAVQLSSYRDASCVRRDALDRPVHGSVLDLWTAERIFGPMWITPELSAGLSGAVRSVLGMQTGASSMGRDAADPSAMPLADLADRIIELHASIDRQQAELLLLIGEFHARGGAETLENVGTASWLAFRTRTRRSSAASIVTLAKRLRTWLPRVHAAALHGLTSMEHARSAAQAVRDLTPEQRPDADDQLAQWSAVFQGDDFGSLARRYGIVTATEHGLRSHERQLDARRMSLSQTLDGSWIGSMAMDAEAGQTLADALEPLCRPLGKDDIRTAPQRRIDPRDGPPARAAADPVGADRRHE
jgi:hypothetical protein